MLTQRSKNPHFLVTVTHPIHPTLMYVIEVDHREITTDIASNPMKYSGFLENWVPEEEMSISSYITDIRLLDGTFTLIDRE